ncbi:hypothetical protein JCM8208_001896 [Rhodotorula glutinis]
MAAHPPTPTELSLDSNVSSAIQTYRGLWYVRRGTDPEKERSSYQIKTNALLEWILEETRRLDVDQSLHDPIVAVLNAFSIVLGERRHPVPAAPARSLGRSSRAPSSSLGLRQQWLYFKRRY